MYVNIKYVLMGNTGLRHFNIRRTCYMTLPIKAFLYKKSMLYDIALKAFLY